PDRRQDMRIAKTLAPISAAVLLGACNLIVPPPPDDTTPPVTGTCMAQPAAFAVGRLWTPDLAETARVASNSNTVRTIRPGDAVTLDFRTDRLNLELNSAGVVTTVRCG